MKAKNKKEVEPIKLVTFVERIKRNVGSKGQRN